MYALLLTPALLSHICAVGEPRKVMMNVSSMPVHHVRSSRVLGGRDRGRVHLGCVCNVGKIACLMIEPIEVA